MEQTYIFRHERVDDIPLSIGWANTLHLAEVRDHHMGTHRLQRGLNHGQLAVGWLADILSQADHRKSAVRDWANGLSPTLAPVLGHPSREGECSDDRWGVVLDRLSDDATWEAIAHDLWGATVTAYELALTGIRLDSTPRSGYHHVSEAGVRPRGHRTDHRPDLPQLKRMAAAAEPSGPLIACDVHPGPGADAPRYTPLVHRVRGIVGRSGLRYAGNGKMAALATRAEIAAHHDFSLMPLPLTGATATQVATGVTACVEGVQGATLLWDGAQWLGAGYAWERPLQAMVGGQPVCWTERVQVVRSPTLAQRQQATLAKRLTAAEEALRALTPGPGRGKRHLRDSATLPAAMAPGLAQQAVAGLLTVTWERHETTVTSYVGRGRGGPERPTRTQAQVRSARTGVQRHEEAIAARRHRLGWRVQVTKAPADRRSLAHAGQHDRGGWSLARAFHRVKALPLGLQPLLVWKAKQSQGLTRLLPLALRLLTLLETQVRRALEPEPVPLAGL